MFHPLWRSALKTLHQLPQPRADGPLHVQLRRRNGKIVGRRFSDLGRYFAQRPLQRHTLCSTFSVWQRKRRPPARKHLADWDNSWTANVRRSRTAALLRIISRIMKRFFFRRACPFRAIGSQAVKVKCMPEGGGKKRKCRNLVQGRKDQRNSVE